MSRAARGTVLALVGVVVLAAALRVAVASLSPVLAAIDAEISVPSTVVGLIGAAPPVAFAVFGILTPSFARRVPLEALAAIAAGLSAAGLVARAFSADATTLLITTLVAFAGIGVGNVVLPALIKKYFPASIGRMTTLYIATMSIATFVPPAVAVPLAESAGWRVSLGVWAVVGVIALVPWVALLLRPHPDTGGEIERPDAKILARLLRVPLTWALVGGMLVTAATVYSMFAWLPTLLREHAGVDPAAAGVMVGVFGGMGLPFSLLVPLLVERFRVIRTVTVLAVAPGLAGVAGMLGAPAAAPWLWVVLMSLPTAFFPLVLVLIGLRTRSHATTVALSGAVQSIGYGVGALFPLLIGALHESTDGWHAALWVLAGVFALGIPSGLVAARVGSVEDAWEHRTGGREK